MSELFPKGLMNHEFEILMKCSKDTHLMHTVEGFATGSSPIRMLIATDVASEGINLHHECHHIIHFDLPWSIITLIQKNGRIDRLGQEQSPVLRYLMVDTDQGLLKGDKAIFERLIDKVEEINSLRRSGESVLKLYDSKQEEEYIADQGILSGNLNVLDTPATKSSDDFSEADFLENMLKEVAFSLDDELQPQDPPSVDFSESSQSKRFRLFTDKDFFLQGYKYLSEANPHAGFHPIQETGKLMSNRCLQQVIKLLSLSPGERSREIGRVNYAELGINQLGAVYEGLLSYKGMFADKDLIQVKPAGKKWTEKKTPTWFVGAERLEEFKTDEVKQINDKHRVYPKGSFILHLSGIDREQSASYYTPEVLTKCLVEEALRELLKDYGPCDADKILDLKICEPAMGSGAFLNEATHQLAKRYLELKQEEINQRIEPARFQDEIRRVQHYIATRNVYGVDLNATAVELGALSLWLGSIHRLLIKEGENGQPDIYKPGATPWFGLRLRCGNSLIGARRSVWTKAQLIKGRHFGKNSAVPRLLKPGEKRKKDEIYHFLVFDEDMIPTHKDKVMKKFDLTSCDDARAWIAREVKTKWDEEDVSRAIEISKLIDEHWIQYSEQRAVALAVTACTASVWPVSSDSKQALEKGPSLKEQERIKQNLEATSGSFQRLKLIMDTWCSLWFWPLDQTERLPRRTGFLEAAKILLGDKPPTENLQSFLSTVFDFDIEGLFDAAKEEIPDTEILSGIVSWYGIGKEIAEEQNFHHWELIFSEILGPSVKGGFSLIIGNPPWANVKWFYAPVLYEIEPVLGVKESKSAQLNSFQNQLIDNQKFLDIYSFQFRKSQGIIKYLGNVRCFPSLLGVQCNLYKNFIFLSWQYLSITGIGGLIHEEGVFDDHVGGNFRKSYYQRLSKHFQFKNELYLFQDVDHHKIFSLNIFDAVPKQSIQFDSISNLFHPKTIKNCLKHKIESDPVPGFKTEEGKWQTIGHQHRVVRITNEELKSFVLLFEKDNQETDQSRLPHVHSLEILRVLKKFSLFPTKLIDIEDTWMPSVLFSETYAQRDGFITRTTTPTFTPANSDDWVISGPHYYVANPLMKSPRTDYSKKNDYDDIDLTDISANFYPRSVYRPGNKKKDLDKYNNIKKNWVFNNTEARITSKFRYVNRDMCHSTNERTLISSIIPQGATAINSSLVVTFEKDTDLLSFSGSSFSIPFNEFKRRYADENNISLSGNKS